MRQVTDEERRLWKLNPGPKARIEDFPPLTPAEESEVAGYFADIYRDYRSGSLELFAMGELLGLSESGAKHLPTISRILSLHGIKAEFLEDDSLSFRIRSHKARCYDYVKRAWYDRASERIHKKLRKELLKIKHQGAKLKEAA